MTCPLPPRDINMLNLRKCAAVMKGKISYRKELFVSDCKYVILTVKMDILTWVSMGTHSL